MARHYLDHASTSPLRPAARDALVAALDLGGGDPGRIHEEGMTARVALEQAREQVAALVGARPREVVFTSGATEAIASVAWGAARRGGHQVVTAVEHSAVPAAAARHGDVTVVGVDGHGRVDPDAVAAAIRDDTAVVHVQWGNHEVGTTQPVGAVVEAAHARGVLVHVDAAQAVGRVPVDLRSLGADLVSLSGHKWGAPSGTGALLVRRGLRLEPLLVGSDQERARRAGMEAVPALVGLGAAAASLLDGTLAAEEAEARRLTDRVLAGVADLDVRVHGDPVDRLPHLVCLGFDDVEPQAVLLGLDRAGVAVHSGSACSSESLEPSPTLAAMGVDALRSLRVSVGWSTTDADVDALLAALPEVLRGLRALRRRGPAHPSG
ncbi:cysteine desulfurase [Iamia sp. SCSIO 61187]|uniref:cysteine desulfurase family protein n=1 Tax=Iamia sp. SCSIO 61187 TaxID=2722752 RepID=UPI001C625F0F|nr:cysteine desulfurase family protein [Iamia sp. SCSIO 61187]QYG91516.1 cysteine desulfurase [Iamia sp. SCSIO 61187]